MTSVAVLQARTNSTRLPGKVLLPINGLPLAVLAAKRAANTGREVIVATSTMRSDDGLAALAQSHGLGCFRGSLENTLERVVHALARFDDETLVFRLTADNVFPDGALLDEMEREFVAEGLEYLCCNGKQSGLPYGMSVEVTRLAHLREADRESISAYEREHVTPYVAKKFGVNFFGKYKNGGKGHFRCTIDCLDDYLCIQRVFSDVIDPIYVSAFDLVSKLTVDPLQPTVNIPVCRLVVGTAQLGGAYGIANRTGQPSQATSQALIKTAISNGVVYLDTARAYGNSEQVIGKSLEDGWQGRAKVITKLSPMLDCPPDASEQVLNAFVDASVFQSSAALRSDKLDVLLLHRSSHLSDWEGRAWRRLLSLQQAGMIGDLGVSVQNPDELSRALDIPEVQYVQLPFNLLDWRWDMVILKILEVKSRRNLVVHVRGAFLQGLLLSTDESLWRRACVNSSIEVCRWLGDCAKTYLRDSIADLCLSYVNSLPWVDGVTVGMENLMQLRGNLDLFNRPTLTASQVQEINKERPRLTETSLNPALWKG